MKQFPYSKPLKILGMHSSKEELIDLFIAWLVFSAVFAVVFNPGLSFSSTKFLTSMLFSAVTVGLGFICHEMSHKIIAQKYGCWAEFRANYPMLLFAVVVAFFGLVFAAPGAVFIGGKKVNKNINGLISIAGVAANIVLSILFMVLLLASGAFLHELFYFGMMINAWLAVFNLLPFFFFDGLKVWRWNRAVYAIAAVAAVALMIASALIK